MVRMAMPHSLPNDSIPEPVKDQKPVDDVFAARLAERIGSRGVSVGGDTLLILATRSQESG